MPCVCCSWTTTSAARTQWRSLAVFSVGKSTAPLTEPASKPRPAGATSSVPTEPDAGRGRLARLRPSRLRSSRLRPRTVRGRATAAVALVASLAVAACSVVLLYAVHTNLVASAQSAARDHVEEAAERLASGTSPGDVEAALPDVGLEISPPPPIQGRPQFRKTRAAPAPKSGHLLGCTWCRPTPTSPRRTRPSSP